MFAKLNTVIDQLVLEVKLARAFWKIGRSYRKLDKLNKLALVLVSSEAQWHCEIAIKFQQHEIDAQLQVIAELRIDQEMLAIAIASI